MAKRLMLTCGNPDKIYSNCDTDCEFYYNCMYCDKNKEDFESKRKPGQTTETEIFLVALKEENLSLKKRIERLERKVDNLEKAHGLKSLEEECFWRLIHR